MKKHYKTAIRMAWPSVLESFFIALAAMIDTMMVGSLGSYAIAAVGLTTQPKFLGFSIFFAMNIAVSALVARRNGEEDRRGANEIFLTAMVLALILCILLSLFFVSFADPIIRIAGSELETHGPAVEYFRIIMGGMIFNIVAMCINAAMRGSGNTRIAFITNLISSLVNVVFNYFLIGGNFGFPAWGVKGAAIATVAGSAVAMVMSLISLFRGKDFVTLGYLLKKKIRAKMETALTILRLATTIFLENLAMRVGFMATALIAAQLGTRAFAAHNAGMNILSIGFSFGDGMQVAAVALAGSALGEQKPEEARLYGKVCQRIGFMISIAMSLFLLLFGRAVMSIYFREEDLIAIGLMVTRFIMVIVLLQISQIIYGGALRAGGDVKYTLMVGIVAVALIRTVVTIILVNFFQLGLVGIWLGILSDQMTRFILLRHRFNQGRWTQIRI